MQDLLPDLCDHFEELVQVVEPMFGNYGGRETFGGQIVTIKAFEDNSLVREQVAQPGEGKVLVVDGGGSMRRAMLGDMWPKRHRTTVGKASSSTVASVMLMPLRNWMAWGCRPWARIR